MSQISSLKIGGKGEVLYAKSIDEVREAVSYAKESMKEVVPIGMGTNIFFGDDLSKYVFLKLEINTIKKESDTDYVYYEVGASVEWDNLVCMTVSDEVYGLENLSLIPGSVGASPYQNIGAYGAEVKDVVYSVKVFDTLGMTEKVFLNHECDFSYRNSIFKKSGFRYIIVSVIFKLSKNRLVNLKYSPLDKLDKNVLLEDIRKKVIEIRKAKLPDHYTIPNCGSYFENAIIPKHKYLELLSVYNKMPAYEVDQDRVKIPTAWLIEHVAEMKGVNIRGIESHKTQSLVITNVGNAKVSDLLYYENEIRARIFDKTGITVEREVRYIS